MRQSQKRLLLHAASLRVFPTCFCQGSESTNRLGWGCSCLHPPQSLCLPLPFPALQPCPAIPGLCPALVPVLGPDSPLQADVPVPGRWHLPGLGLPWPRGKDLPDPGCPKPSAWGCLPAVLWQHKHYPQWGLGAAPNTQKHWRKLQCKNFSFLVNNHYL